MEEPDWDKLWQDKISPVTYVGHMKPIQCSCGDMDRIICNCAKDKWINKRKEKFKHDSKYIPKCSYPKFK